MVAAVVAATISCSSDDPKQDYNPLIDNPQQPEQPAEPDNPSVGRNEQYRPQIHFTPAKNWMNDPNGMVYLNGTFSIPSMQAPLNVTGNSVTLDLFVDQSSIEVFTAEGTMSMTNLVFPTSIYNSVMVTGADATLQFRQLKSIWK